ncbi:MAG: hypothetical protein AB1758_29600 [Candidatus Eremiobacterota bacterium]
MTWRRFILAGSLVFLVLALPGDLSNIFWGGNWRLSLGLSLKTLMAVLAILGIWKQRSYGQPFLFGITAQSSLIRVGEFQAVAGLWSDYWSQLVLPGLELLFRLFCLIYLGLELTREVSKRGKT